MKPRQICWFLLAAAILAVAGGDVRAADKEPGDELVGKWWFPKKNGKFEVERVKGKYFGKVIAYDKVGSLDKHNPDPELAKRPFIGVEMLSDFVYNPKKKQWADGTIYDGDSGKTYSCTLWFENNDMNQLYGRGYIGVSLFGRTETFVRLTKEEEKTFDEEKKKEAEEKEKAAK